MKNLKDFKGFLNENDEWTDKLISDTGITLTDALWVLSGVLSMNKVDSARFVRTYKNWDIYIKDARDLAEESGLDEYDILNKMGEHLTEHWLRHKLKEAFKKANMIDYGYDLSLINEICEIYESTGAVEINHQRCMGFDEAVLLFKRYALAQKEKNIEWSPDEEDEND